MGFPMLKTRPRNLQTYGLACVLALGSAIVLVATGSRASDGREAAGVFPPWWPAARVISAAAAAGDVRDLGAVPFIVTVRDPGGRAVERLRQSGALFAVAPAGSSTCAS
jgi:hypothetical protein